MELRMLKYFLTVAEEQNITRAAEKLHITQPTLSRQIRDFEDSFQVDLFFRKNRKLYLTEPGVFLKKKAEEMLALDEKIEHEFSNFQNAVLNGQITIGCVEATNSTFLAKMLDEMIAEHPSVTFEIYSGTSNDIIEKLERGLLDLAVLIEPFDIDHYHAVRLPEMEKYGLLVSNDHHLASKSAIKAEDLIHEPLIYSSREGVQNMFRDWGDYHDTDLNIVGKYNLIFNVVPLVENKIGAAVTIEGVVQERLQQTKFLPFDPSLETYCALVWKKDSILNPTASAFVDRTKNALKA